ncbi:MAG TPA: hypothetical protein VFP84_32660 [Kofleriaceae bacterium]|nr:hypothetical protein [Kofleriaceae bacterium]
MTPIKHLRWLALALPFAVLAPACAEDEAANPAVDEAEQAVTTAAFTATYVGQGANASTCNTTFTITGQEPTGTGTNPVFLYMIGTGETATNASATAAVAAMAAKGYVAATIAYDSGSFNSCGPLDGKARCIFNAGSSTSAVSALCARAKADCSKGIVVGGFSQGSVLATQAKNFDARVRAAWGMGDGVSYSFFNLSACQADGNRALPSSNLRAVVGQQDQFVGGGLGTTPGSESTARSQLQSLTGLSCGTTATTCLRANGSGWILVQNGQVADGSADHCFMRTAGNLCSASQNSLDANWRTGNDNWSLNASLAWLDSFVTH